MSEFVHFLSNEQLLDVLSLTKVATAIHVTEDAIIQTANEAMLRVWGKDKSVIGETLEDALPELRGQPFAAMFRKVWHEGITISGTDTRADLIVDGALQTFYFDFEYRAVKNEQGQTYCILHTATDITERYLSRQREQALTEELTATNEELTASNEELRAANEELAALNEELIVTTEELGQSQDRLQEMNNNLKQSESRFRNLVQQAPVGICVIRAGDLTVDEVNDAYLELVGKKREEFAHRTIWEAVPEAAEAYAPIMNQVIKTGVPFVANEHELHLVRKGVTEQVFVNFVYEPVKQSDGLVSEILVVGIEITEQVIARRLIQDAEERSRLAVDAAEIGTFDLDIPTSAMLTSQRFNHIFGFDRHVAREVFAAAIHPEDLKIRDRAFDEAIASGKLIYEARVLHADQSVHWIRVQGKVYYNEQKQPMRILGTVLDITELKRLQQQKDDFISIASHELKTPITSLRASIQLMNRMKDMPAAEGRIAKLIEQADKSMQKVIILIDELLNVSRMNEGQLQLSKTQFTLSHLLNQCCQHVRMGGNYNLIFQGDENLTVYADEHRIDQVVVNFINNAVKYAPGSKDIYLTVERQGNMARIAVKDTGPGIDPEKQAHLFNRYYRADYTDYQTSGLGLGLYISSEIIKKHGGNIGVESEPGKGSSFWFTLPLN